uniref:Uncharacterized protein n=1 Tax=Arundo donax TaxID=35708 RepID=A0A0A9FRU5_ARUDO
MVSIIYKRSLTLRNLSPSISYLPI